jgi:hypothetical protein
MNIKHAHLFCKTISLEHSFHAKEYQIKEDISLTMHKKRYVSMQAKSYSPRKNSFATMILEITVAIIFVHVPKIKKNVISPHCQ